MALGYELQLRRDRVALVGAQIDAGTAGFFRIYTGPRPASGGAATTLLAQLTFSATSFGAPGGDAAVDANAITPDSSANATGTAVWFRMTDSAGAFVVDGDIGLTGSGDDLEMNSLAIGLGQEVRIDSFEIGEGNE